MECNGVINFIITLPNAALSGNCLILGIQYPGSGTITSVTDNQGNTWTQGLSATNATYNRQMAIYYALNVAAGTQVVTIAFNGLSGVSASSPTQAVLSEFYNVAPSAASDGSTSSPTSTTSGTITTSASGDLIYHWGASLSTDTPYGGSFNGTSITAGTNFTLLSADLQVGSCDQYYVQPSGGAINPSFTPSGSATWGSLAIALKAASAGTAPGPGIRIVHVQHTLIGSLTTGSNAAPIPLQFPSTGNLLVGLFNYAQIASVSDSAGNTWSCPVALLSEGAQIVYAANASTSPNLSGVTLTLSNGSSGGQTFQSFLVLYDVAGAATSPYDTGATANGQQTSNGDLTTVSITPSTSNGLVFGEVSIAFQTINGLVGPGYILDSVVNTQDDDNPGGPGTQNSSLEEDNGYGHVYNANTDELTFEWTYNSSLSGGGEVGAEGWAAVAAAFEASQGTSTATPNPTPSPTATPAPVAPPASLDGVVHWAQSLTLRTGKMFPWHVLESQLQPFGFSLKAALGHSPLPTQSKRCSKKLFGRHAFYFSRRLAQMQIAALAPQPNP
jgi:hypothetical protein